MNRVLVVHNEYQQRGGEDAVVDAEVALLKSKGHDVMRLRAHNDALRSRNSLRVAAEAIWNGHFYHQTRETIRAFRPAIVHVHNTFPQLSPAVYYAARTQKVAVVQTIHNYRLVCANAFLLRGGSVCEACVGRTFGWPGVLHRCYRDSRAATAAVAAINGVHTVAGTWARRVQRYIALTEFARQKLIQGGLPTHRIAVKPNFIDETRSPVAMPQTERTFVLFVGRLSEEKGLRTLLAAWRTLSHIPLMVAGTGPLESELRQLISTDRIRNVTMLGAVQPHEVMGLLQHARFVVMPSEWYEGFPVTLAESFACGAPAVVSRIGSLREIVRDGGTGLHFTPTDIEDLRKKVSWAWAHVDEVRKMGLNAREEYQERFSPHRNYQLLMRIYQDAAAEGLT